MFRPPLISRLRLCRCAMLVPVHTLTIAPSSYTLTGPRAPGQLTGQTREIARVTVRLTIVECACAVETQAIHHERNYGEESSMNTMLSKTVGTLTRPYTQLSCNRCSGCLESEMCIDLESDTGYCTFWTLRCLQCGDIVDETILRNRARFHSDAALVTAA